MKIKNGCILKAKKKNRQISQIVQYSDEQQAKQYLPSVVYVSYILVFQKQDTKLMNWLCVITKQINMRGATVGTYC